MAAPETTGIKQTVATKIYTDTTPTGPKPNAQSFRETYNAVIDWVVTSIKNASPFRKLSDSTGATDESDIAFRTGRTIIGGSQDDGTGSALQVRGTASIDGLFANNGDGKPVATTALGGQGILRFVANLTPGLSDFSIVNANIRSRVTAFYYAIDGNFLRLVLIMRENRVGIGGIIQPAETLDVDGRTRTYGLVAAGPKPRASVLGSGLGTSGSIVLEDTATDQAGRFAITTGSNPAVDQMARITFANSLARTPVCVIITPAGPNSAQHYGKVTMYPEFATGLILGSSGGAALPANTTFNFNYLVIA